VWDEASWSPCFSQIHGYCGAVFFSTLSRSVAEFRLTRCPQTVGFTSGIWVAAGRRWLVRWHRAFRRSGRSGWDTADLRDSRGREGLDQGLEGRVGGRQTARS
jgi:hypothetical protein